jgi:hypothetical protein
MRSIERKVSDKPTIFVTAINALVNIEFSNEDDIDSFNNFSINDKIDHNQIARWKHALDTKVLDYHTAF